MLREVGERPELREDPRGAFGFTGSVVAGLPALLWLAPLGQARRQRLDTDRVASYVEQLVCVRKPDP